MLQLAFKFLSLAKGAHLIIKSFRALMRLLLLSDSLRLKFFKNLASFTYLGSTGGILWRLHRAMITQPLVESRLQIRLLCRESLLKTLIKPFLSDFLLHVEISRH